MCLTPEGQSQDHFRATSGAHELRVCVGLMETFFFFLPLFSWSYYFLGSEHDFHILDRIFVGDLNFETGCRLHSSSYFRYLQGKKVI